MNHASQSLLNYCQFTSPFLRDLMNSSTLPETIPYDELCGTFLKEYREDTSLIPSTFSSDSNLHDILSLSNAFPSYETLQQSSEEKRRRQTRRRSSLLIFQQSNEQQLDGSSSLTPQLNDNDDDDDDDDAGDNPFGMDFICNNDYGNQDEEEVNDMERNPLSLQPSKIQWDSVFDNLEKRNSVSQEINDFGASSVTQMLPSVDWTQSSYGYATLPHENNILSLSSQFTSLNLQTSNHNNNSIIPLPFNQSTNAWAGANHWKSKLHLKRNHETKPLETEVKKTTTKRTTKTKFSFNFMNLHSDISEYIDTITWESSKKKNTKGKSTSTSGSSTSSRLDPRLLSETILKKQQKNAKDLLLPEDQKIERKDLYR